MANFSWFELIKNLPVAIVAALVASLGWYVTNNLSKKKELENKRRETVIRFLIDAYRDIEASLNAKDKFDPVRLQRALSDVVLFGTIAQVNLAENFKDGVNEKRPEMAQPLVELLFNLRNSLRNELHIEKDERKVLPQFYISFDKK